MRHPPRSDRFARCAPSKARQNLSVYLGPFCVPTPESLSHIHDDLPASHPHLHGAHNGEHEHVYIIDDLHHSWPRSLQSSAGSH